MAGCDHRGCLGWTGHRDRLPTIATGVTVVRTVVSLVLVVTAVVERSWPLLLAGLAVYWVGDVLDGAVARRTGTETRTGALLDVLCDRVGCGTFYLGFLVFEPAMAVPVSIFLLQFMVLDAYLSLAFLRWPLHSGDYFYRVDRPIWLLNWSKPAKAVNSGGLALTMLVWGSVPAATVLVLAVTVVKTWSVVRLERLPRPDATMMLTGCTDPMTAVAR